MALTIKAKITSTFPNGKSTIECSDIDQALEAVIHHAVQHYGTQGAVEKIKKFTDAYEPEYQGHGKDG